MLGRETWVPEHLTYHVPAPELPVHEYVGGLIEIMGKAHDALCVQQWQTHSVESEEPPLYQVGDWVWMVSYHRRRGQSAKLQPKFVGPYCVVKVLPNHTYRVERWGQVSVQSEQCLKPYQASPDAVRQTPPLLEPNRQPNHRERTTQPREVKIVVPRETDQEQAALLEQLERQQQQERQQEQQQRVSGPPPPPGDDTPTRIAGRSGDPLPMVVADEPLAPAAPVLPERSQRTRRPPRYLADYAVGQLELPSREGSPSNTDDYSILVRNSLHYPEEFYQEEGNSDRISEGTRLHELSFRNSREFPTVRVTRASAGNNSGTRGPAISTSTTTLTRRISESDLKLISKFCNSFATVMGGSSPTKPSRISF